MTIRAIRPEDRIRMADTLKGLSDQTFYRRTFAPKHELSEADLKQLTEVDFENVVALVAEMQEEGRDRIVGGGRYLRMGDATPDRAEVAFLMDDMHQGLGIGSRIFRHLVAIACASGITKFEAEVLSSNVGMLKIFERSGLPVSRKAVEGTIHITIDLKVSTS